MRPGLVGRYGVLPGRMACVLAVALLTCAFAAHAQVIEEGGFPVKGGGVSGESFSLFCPSRFAVQAGSSIALSCSATAVPEEGVRYEWESLSGDGFRLLSASDELSPLFTAPFSEPSAEYAYRLTAMSVGVYETATVTVTVESIPGETVGAPVVQEECDSLVDFEGGGRGECLPWDKAPPQDPFGGIPEDEGIVPWPSFPEGPGAEGKESPVSSGGGSFPQTPPYLECPPAVFLEELETGAIECRVSDAAGEEYLDFVWEPVGNTMRDYLENPRLMPENAPNPSVVAPEAPVYETLESFRSKETTFRYRYRLTATSRATGLSSSSEVEVFVSSSRPSVYCPLEIVVEEGETIALDCEGVDPLSARMDYDEEAASVLWEWEGLWGTSMAPLDATDLSSPLFTAPPGSAGKQYHYIASMTSQASGVPRTARRKVTVTVTGAEEGTQAAADASALANKGRVPVITCNDPPPLLDVVPHFGEKREYELDCSVTDPPADPTYRWEGTEAGSRLTNRDSLKATFDVPNITIHNKNQQTEDFDYTVTLSSPDMDDDVTADVTITLRERQVTCWVTATEKLKDVNPFTVDEGSSNLLLETCEGGITSAEGGPYSYRWRGSNEHALGDEDVLLTATDKQTVSFIPPSDLPRETQYNFYFTVFRESEPITTDNFDGGGFRITVNNLDPVECNDPRGFVYEESAAFALDCTDKGTLSNVTWEWDPTDYLMHHDTVAPTFTPPAISEQSKTIRYTVRAKVGGVDMGGSDVTVRVLRKHFIGVTCPGDPYSEYEGEDDIVLDCSASGNLDPYTYVWTARGSTSDTDKLISGTNGPRPTFDVPMDGEIDSDQTYEYTLTVSAENSDDGVSNVTVRVLRKHFIGVTCPGNPYSEYEGEENFDLDCSASGASGYTYEWTARGNTPNTDLLIGDTDGPTPTFDVLRVGEVAANETYEYTLTVSADNAEPDTEDVTVTIRNKSEIMVTCPGNPYEAYEGAGTITLDCLATGAPQGSTYEYEWTGRGSTVVPGQLSGTDIEQPTFDVPADGEVDSDEIYEYTLTVSAEGAKEDVANVTVTVKNKLPITVTCADNSPEVYEGADNITLDCSASGGPQGSTYTYAWTPRGNTGDTSRLNSTTIEKPTFNVPGDGEVDSDQTYEYKLTVTADNAEDGVADVTVRVLDKKPLEVACATPAPVFEGAPDFDLDCVASGAPSGSTIEYAWTPRGGTSDTDKLSSTTIEDPTFDVPETVEADETYEYLLTASAENAIDATAEVTVRVLKLGSIAIICTSTPLVYEGSEDFALDCSISGDTEDSDYTYEWTARGETPNTSLLSATNITSPTFLVPDDIAATTTYEYLLTASAEGVRDATAPVSVTVLNKGTLAVACVTPSPVYEGSANFALDCEASGAPEGSSYEYVWTARGLTANTDLLIAGTDGPTPTFSVPDALDATTTYEYLLTVSAENAEDGSAEVTVTVLDYGALSVACADPPLVYDGSADFDLDCSASGAPEGSRYTYVWTARGETANTDLLIAGTDGPTPTFAVPDALDETTTYEYLLTVSAEQVDDGSAAVTVTVLKTGELHVVCTSPVSVYEGSEGFALDCTVLGAPEGSSYEYAWAPRGSTANTDLLSDVTLLTPTFRVPDDVPETTTYEYLLTVSAENAEDGSAAVTVTVLHREMLSVTCPGPLSVYEGSEDFELDCSALGASDYTYAWTARGDTQDTSLLSAADIASPTFYVPDDLDATTTYEYLLTASAANTISGTAEAAVTVLNKPALAVVCADPGSAYEGSEDIAFDCTVSITDVVAPGAPVGNPQFTFTFVWTARGDTQGTALLSATDIRAPAFYVPDAIDVTTTYEYLLTVSAENAISGTAEVSVTVLNKGALAVTCADPGSVYEGSEDITFDCSASRAPGDNPQYTYAWTARDDTQDMSLLSATDIASPAFAVPDEVAATTTYEYLLTVSAENAEDASAEVTVTVLNKEMLSVTCDDTEVYEGEGEIMLDCSASGAPSGSAYTYVWAGRGSTANTDLLLAGTDGPTPTFTVPDEVGENGETYEYLLTVSAANAEDGTAEVTVNVLDGLPLAFVDDSISGRVYVFTVGETIADILLSEATGGLLPYTHILTPLLSRGLSLKIAGDSTWTISGTPLEVSPRTEYTWQVTDANSESVSLAFFIQVIPAAEPSRPVAEPSEALSLGVTVSTSSLRFGVQSAQTQVSLDPMTDGISTRVSGPYHAGRMTLSPGGSEALDENGEMDLSIELASPVVLRREGGIEAASIVLSPSWSLAESCEQLSSQTIGSLYTEVTLSDACRLLRFGGELDLTDVLSGQYTGSLDLILRSGESEETHTVDVEVTVIPAQQVITIGPGGVRFSTSRELPVSLSEEQNLSIYPHVAFLTAKKLHGVFELSNPSLIPLEVSVSARFGYTEATENGREVVVEDASGSHLGDLSEVVDIHPGVLVLMPGEKGLVRYGVKEGALSDMDERGYATFFDVVSSPRQYVRSDQMPEEVSGDRTARVTMRIPGVYVPGEGASQLRAALLSISYVGSLSATFLLETQDHPFVGEVLAYDGEGRELGRRETLVYTRSRVRIPLERVPEGGAVFLRFAPRGSDRVPEPASVEWDAPRRDIGAAEDKDRSRTPETLVQKP